MWIFGCSAVCRLVKCFFIAEQHIWLWTQQVKVYTSALQVTQEIKYAKNIYDENIQTLQEVEEVEDEDW